MRHLFHRRPSAAMVVAVLALAVASSGTAVAASTLVSGDSLIKKQSLSGNRLKNRTVTGRQIKISSLPTVPSATSAAKATIAQVTYVSAPVTVPKASARVPGTASCPAGTTVIGGGASVADAGSGNVSQSGPAGKTGWTAVIGDITQGTTGTVYAICAPAAATSP